MSASVNSWASIALFHNTIKTLNFLREREQQPLPRISYRAKVKLHGTNSAIQRTADGVYPQSRTTILKSGVDNKGFGEWVRKNDSAFLQLTPGTTVFGEWCGPGVEKGMAVSALDRKIFSVFALQLGIGDSAIIVIDPNAIEAKLPQHPDMYVLSWYKDELVIDFAKDLTKTTDLLNSMVETVEKEDPWVKDMFDIKGIGEGLVFYPILKDELTYERFSMLGFKAKGEKHRTVAARKAAQVNPEIAANALSFAQLVVTEGRLEQGVSEVCNDEYDMKHTGALVRWIASDVQKECQSEMEISKLTWKQVSNSVVSTTRDWYRMKASSD